MENGSSSAVLTDRRAWLAWGLLWLIFAGEGLFGRPPSVGRVYRESARHWWAQQPLYNQIGKGFLYLPHAAVLQTPFAALPEGWAEVAWRTVTIGIFAVGVRRLARLASPVPGDPLFGWMTLVSIPLGFSAARNGQAQLIVAGLAMLTAEALCRRQWNRAALWLWVGLAFKPVMLPFLLVAGVLQAPLLPRLAIGGVAFLIFPCLGQSFEYVIGQYQAFWDSFERTTDLGISRPYAQVFGLLQVWGLSVPAPLQSLLRVVAGLGVVGLLWTLKDRLPRPRQAVYFYIATAACLQLFNPRSENNGYAILAPGMGLLLGEALVRFRSRRLAVGVAMAAALTLLGYELQVRVAPDVRPIWLAPLMGLVYVGLQGAALLRELRTPAEKISPEELLIPRPNVSATASTVSTTRSRDRFRSGTETTVEATAGKTPVTDAG
jgi:hypothetical protein